MHLTEHHKENCLEQINDLIDNDRYFDDFYQYIHIGKRWFVLVEDSRAYYLASNKTMPHCNVQQKLPCHKGDVFVCCCLASNHFIHWWVVACKVGHLGVCRDGRSKAVVQELFKGNNEMETNAHNKRIGLITFAQACFAYNQQEMAKVFFVAHLSLFSKTMCCLTSPAAMRFSNCCNQGRAPEDQDDKSTSSITRFKCQSSRYVPSAQLTSKENHCQKCQRSHQSSEWG